MAVVAPTPKWCLLPFEQVLMEAVAGVLQPEPASLFTRQVASINRVQRLLDWKEIEFYCMRWFRVRWPEAVLFPRRDEHRLAQIRCRFGEKETDVTVWAVGGHVFSLEAPVGLSGLSISGALTVLAVSPGK